MAQFGTAKVYGNVMSINTPKSGKVKYINISQANFADKTKDNLQYNIAVFAKDFDKIAQIEADLAAVRTETGRANAALQHVGLTYRVVPSDSGIQLVFAYVTRKSEPKATVAKPAVEATTVAEKPAEVKAAATDDIPF